MSKEQALKSRPKGLFILKGLKVPLATHGVMIINGKQLAAQEERTAQVANG